MTVDELKKTIAIFINKINSCDHKIKIINEIRICISEQSPFIKEPVDCVIWVKDEDVISNDYNPNVMAPAEKILLNNSLSIDGFTQPIVTSQSHDKYLIVDGFHRYTMGKSGTPIGKRTNGYIPVTCIKRENQGEPERIASTIRHNRARGKHHIASMAEIVRDLCRLGWDDTRIGLELGMEPDEILRFKQLNGLVELFMEEEYSQAWSVD